MSKRHAAIITKLEVDGAGFRSELVAAEAKARGASASIAKSFDRIEQAARKNRSSISSLRSAFSSLAGTAGGAASKFGSAASALTGAFAGGALLGGISLAAAGIAKIVSHYQELQREADEARQRQVDSWNASITKIEDATVALREQARIKKLLLGLDSPIARNAKLADEEHKIAAQRIKDLEAEAEAYRKAKSLRPQTDSRVTKYQSNLAAELINQVEKVDRRDFDKELAEARAAERKAAKALSDAIKLRGENPEEPGPAGRIPSFRLQKESGSKRAEIDFEKLTQRSILDTADIRATITRDEIALIDNRLARALAALNEESAKEGATSEYRAALLEQRQALEAEAEIARTEIRNKEAEQARLLEETRYQFALQTSKLEATLTESKLDDLQIAHDEEIRKLQQLLENKLIDYQSYYDRLAVLESVHIQNIEQMQEAETKALQQKREQQVTDGMNTGVAIGGAMASGIRSALEAKNTTRGFFKTLLGLGQVVASFFGPAGIAVSGGLGVVSGMFADGGKLHGPGGPRSDNLLFAGSPGEWVINSASSKKYGDSFLKAINDGTLEITDHKKGSNNHGSSTGFSSSSTNVYVQAMDPASTVQALDKVFAPATYNRGMTRADSKEVAMQRRRIARPRTGRA